MVNLPSFSDITGSFGFQLAAVREPRTTQEGLAKRLNQISAEQYGQTRRDAEARREQIEAEIKAVNARIEDSKSVVDVDAKLVREWEKGTKFPTESQYEIIKKTLNDIKPLTPNEIEELEKAYSYGARNATQGNSTKGFGEVLSDMLYSRMAENDLTPKDMVEYIRMIAEQAGGPAQFEQQRATLQRELETMPKVEPREYYMVDVNGDKKKLIDAEGNLKLTGEHLRMIEHGAIPSQNLYEVIVEGLKNIKQLGNGEQEGLKETHDLLISEATKHFNSLLRRDVIKEDPLNGHTKPPAPVVTVAPPVPKKEERPVVLPVQKEIPKVKAEVPPPPAPVPPAPIIPAVAVVAATPPAKAVEDEPPATLPFTPAPSYKTTEAKVAALAETYVALFAAFGLQAPSNAGEATTRKDNSEGARAALALKAGLGKTALPELSPFSLTEIRKNIANNLVKTPGVNVMEVTRLIGSYNRLVNEIYEDISASESGRKLQSTLSVLEQRLNKEERKTHRIEAIKRLNSITGVPQADFSDYMAHAGLRMPHAPDIEKKVIQVVNQQWFINSDREHNVFGNNSQVWRRDTQNYIDAWKDARGDYEVRKGEFENAVVKLLDNQKQNAAVMTKATQYVKLVETKKLGIGLSETEKTALKDLREFEQSDEGFAAAVVKARENMQYIDKEKERRAASSQSGGMGSPA